MSEKIADKHSFQDKHPFGAKLLIGREMEIRRLEDKLKKINELAKKLTESQTELWFWWSSPYGKMLKEIKELSE